MLIHATGLLQEICATRARANTLMTDFAASARSPDDDSCMPVDNVSNPMAHYTQCVPLHELLACGAQTTQSINLKPQAALHRS